MKIKGGITVSCRLIIFLTPIYIYIYIYGQILSVAKSILIIACVSKKMGPKPFSGPAYGARVKPTLDIRLSV